MLGEQPANAGASAARGIQSPMHSSRTLTILLLGALLSIIVAWLQAVTMIAPIGKALEQHKLREFEVTRSTRSDRSWWHAHCPLPTRMHDYKYVSTIVVDSSFEILCTDAASWPSFYRDVAVRMRSGWPMACMQGAVWWPDGGMGGAMDRWTEKPGLVSQDVLRLRFTANILCFTLLTLPLCSTIAARRHRT